MGRWRVSRHLLLCKHISVHSLSILSDRLHITKLKTILHWEIWSLISDLWPYVPFLLDTSFKMIQSSSLHTAFHKHVGTSRILYWLFCVKSYIMCWNADNMKYRSTMRASSTIHQWLWFLLMPVKKNQYQTARTSNIVWLVTLFN